MTLKHGSLIVVGIAAIVAAGVLVNSYTDKGQSSSSDLTSLNSAPIKANVEPVPNVSSPTETLPEQADHNPGTLPQPPREVMRAAMDKTLEAERSRAHQREIDMLLAGGFTMDRIEWLRYRTEELTSKRLQEESERKKKGLPADPYSPRYLFDKDLDLREEIGDDEYERYRKAAGRTTAVAVVGVLAGSNAEAIGLKEGDEVVAYGGRRVFNNYELEKVASENSSGASVLINVRRDGQIIQLAIPMGPVGLQQESWLAMIDKEVERKRER